MRKRPDTYAITHGSTKKGRICPVALLFCLTTLVGVDGGRAEHFAMKQNRTPSGELVPFANAPYPFENGVIPDQNRPFFEIENGRAFHLSPRGGKLWADETYNDNRSLLYIPPKFDPQKVGAAIVLFFHGNLATLDDVSVRQGVPRQLATSGLNAVLVAPQLALKALDSSPGHFYEPSFLAKYLDEAAEHLARYPNTNFRKETFANLPIIIVAYSGGYLATAFSLNSGQADDRIEGVILLDALFGEAGKFEEWIERTKGRTFFISAYSEASRIQNVELTRALLAREIPVRFQLPKTILPGDVIIQASTKAVHNDFVTEAWTTDPLRDVLGRWHSGRH